MNLLCIQTFIFEKTYEVSYAHGYLNCISLLSGKFNRIAA